MRSGDWGPNLDFVSYSLRALLNHLTTPSPFLHLWNWNNGILPFLPQMTAVKILWHNVYINTTLRHHKIWALLLRVHLQIHRNVPAISGFQVWADQFREDPLIQIQPLWLWWTPGIKHSTPCWISMFLKSLVFLSQQGIFWLFFFFFFSFSLGISDPRGLGEGERFGHLVAHNNPPGRALFHYPPSVNVTL